MSGRKMYPPKNNDRIVYVNDGQRNSGQLSKRKMEIALALVVIVVLIAAAVGFASNRINVSDLSKNNIKMADKASTSQNTSKSSSADRVASSSTEPESNTPAGASRSTAYVFSGILFVLIIVLAALVYLIYQRLSLVEEEIRDIRKNKINKSELDSDLNFLTSSVKSIKNDLRGLTDQNSKKTPTERPANSDFNSRTSRWSDQVGQSARTTPQNMERTGSTVSPTSKLEPEANRDKPAARSSFQIFQSDMISDYNLAVNNKNAGMFEEKYKPMKLDVTNVMERMDNPSIDPVFSTKTDGPFYAVDVPDYGHKKYYIVPRIGIVLNDQTSFTTGIEKIFKCMGLKNGEASVRIQADEPAVFDLKSTGEWMPIVIGKLRISYE